MDKLFLVEPSRDYIESFVSMVLEYSKLEDKDYFNMYKEALIDFDKYIEKLLNNSKGINLPKDRVASSTYWLIDKESLVVGVIRIRHELNCEFLKNIVGHIGYDISPSNRRKGYGEVILKLGLNKAKDLNIPSVLITCKCDNLGSARVIEKNGGVFESEILDNTSNNVYKRYWINLKD